MQIDLNADLGEAETDEGQAAELAILDSVTSVNIACGAHAGDPKTIRRTIRAARSRGLAVGAHPGYADREGRGRRELALPLSSVTSLVVEQLRLFMALAREAGVPVVHVKPHGALYNQAVRDPELARALADAVRQVDPALCFVGLAGSPMLQVAESTGLRVAAEAFADRSYQPDGSLVPRGTTRAVLDRPEEVAAQALTLATERRVVAIDGSLLSVTADTICLHGDTPGAALLARKVRSTLEAGGVKICPLPHARQS